MINKSKFIVIDGCEGVGKTTQIKKLKEKFSQIGEDVVFTREPGGSLYAEAIRELILKNEHASSASDATLLMLFNAARRDHLEKTVVPALESGKTVICDRFDSTSYAYQICGREREDLGTLFDTLRETTFELAKPDLYIILHLDPKEGIARKAKQANLGNDERNHMDDREAAFHQRACVGFHKFIEKCNAPSVVIDASQSEDAVFEEIFKAISECR